MQPQNSTQPIRQPKVITGVPWAWGFEDGAKGESIYAGYHLFAGAKLAQYKRGWREGRKSKRH